MFLVVQIVHPSVVNFPSDFACHPLDDWPFCSVWNTFQEIILFNAMQHMPGAGFRNIINSPYRIMPSSSNALDASRGRGRGAHPPGLLLQGKQPNDPGEDL